RRIEEIERHLDDLLLHAADAEEGAPGAERVLGEELEISRPGDVLRLLGGAEDIGRRPAALPGDIVLRHLVHHGFEGGPIEPGLRHRLASHCRAPDVSAISWRSAAARRPPE